MFDKSKLNQLSTRTLTSMLEDAYLLSRKFPESIKNRDSIAAVLRKRLHSDSDVWARTYHHFEKPPAAEQMELADKLNWEFTSQTDATPPESREYIAERNRYFVTALGLGKYDIAPQVREDGDADGVSPEQTKGSGPLRRFFGGIGRHLGITCVAFYELSDKRPEIKAALEFATDNLYDHAQEILERLT